MNWARVRRVVQGSISSEVIMWGGGVRSILLLPLVVRCLETIDVCILRKFIFYVCCSDCVVICGKDCCVAAVVKDSGFSLGVLKCVCVRGVMDVAYGKCECSVLAKFDWKVGGSPTIAIWLPNNDWWLTNTARHEMVTFGGNTVKAQQSHLF